MIKTPEEKLDTLLSRSQVPIIDLAHCGIDEHPHKSVVNKAAQQLQKALSEKGFALLVNHGISEEKLQHAYELFDEFCRLPDDLKEPFLRHGGESQGYETPAQERSTVAKDLKHAFNICTFGQSQVKLPSDELVPNFHSHFSELCCEFKLLANFVMRSLAIALELPPTYFTDRHNHMLEGEDENMSTMRLLYYPPLIDDDGKCELVKGSSTYSYQKCALDRLDIRIPDMDYDDEDVLNQNVTRCKAHVDYGSFTLMAQDSEGGLEVQLPGSDKWHRLGYLPGSIFISSGELIALWTQDRFPALHRRVIIPAQAYIRHRARHAIAFYAHPDVTTTIIPVEVVKQSLSTELRQTSSSSNESIEAQLQNKTRRRSSFQAAKIKIYNAYHHVQKRLKEASHS